MDLNDPIAVVLAVTERLRAAGIRHAVYGGLALAVYGEPRETRDADVAVAGVDTEVAADALSGIAAVSVSFERVRFGGNLVTRLALVGGGELNTADFVEPRSSRFANEALRRALSGSLRGKPVDVLAPEDFVLFKLLSTRDRDLEDARAVLVALKERLDVSFIQAEASMLAREIPDHDVSGRLSAVLDALEE